MVEFDGIEPNLVTLNLRLPGSVILRVGVLQLCTMISIVDRYFAMWPGCIKIAIFQNLAR